MNRITILFSALLISLMSFGQTADFNEKLAAEKEYLKDAAHHELKNYINYDEISRGGTIFYQENFTGLTQIPEGWYIDFDVSSTNEGAGYNNWSVSSSSNAGGQAPELRFNWQPVFSSGYSRMITNTIAIDGATELELFFRQRLSNFTPYTNEMVYVEISTDGAETWTEIWSKVFNETYGPIQMQLPFSVDAETDSIQIGFRFSGNSYNIFNWSIDDILLRSTPQEDLVAGDFSGPNLINAGQQYIFELEVYNNGLNAQEDYSINLMKIVDGEDDIILASAPGNPVDVEGTVLVSIPWTPSNDQVGQMHVYAAIDFDDDQDATNDFSEEMVLRVLNEEAIAISIGSGQNINEHVGFRIPFDFYYKNSLAQVMYYPEELENMLGTINALIYYSTFAETVAEEEVKIYLGVTEDPNFFESNGFISAENHTLVYEGPITIEAGESVMMIELETPFLYTGGNLVVTTNRVFDESNPTYSIFSRYYSTNTPQYVDRTIRNYSNSDAYDPESPPPHVWGGYLSNWHPNTSFVLSLEGVGSVEGIVSDAGGNALQGVKITVEDYPIYTYTDENGAYHMYVPAEELSIKAELFGYYDFETTINVTEDEPSVLNIEMEEIPQVTVSGSVVAADDPDTGIENAQIKLTGFDYYETTTDSDGSFVIENVYINETYTLTVSYPGFYIYQSQVEVGVEDVQLDPVMLEEVPFPVSNVTATEIDEMIHVSWDEPVGATEYRYDDGVVAGQLGFPFGTINSVMGTVHRRNAELHEMSWFLTDEGGPHPVVKVWVFALNENGEPDRTQVLFSQENVPNNNMEWNTFVFPEPLSASNGFMIGVSAPGFLALAVDNGVGDPWAFKPNTQYGSSNVNSIDFFPLESQNFYSNFLIRAYGYDFGEIFFNKDAVADRSGEPELISTGGEIESFYSGKPEYTLEGNAGSAGKNLKALESFSVFRLLEGNENDQEEWTTLASGLTEMEYVDNNWSELEQGFYRYAVIAEYSNEVYSLPAFSNILPKDFEVEFTVIVSTNSGDSPEGALVQLTNLSGNPQHVYSAEVPASGEVVFENVWIGDYQVRVELSGFETWISEIEIQEEGSYAVELIEKITAPVGLEVITDGMNPGEALFRWNTVDLIKLYQHDGEVPAQPNSYYQQFQLGYGVVYDLTPYPDAVVEYLDFYHLQWGLPNDSYPYYVHLVDWDTKQTIETIGPIHTQVNDDWETEVELGSVDVSGVNQLAVLIQPQGNESNDAYPAIGADTTGPDGVSIYVNMNNFDNWFLNGEAMGDFLMNLWIYTGHSGKELTQVQTLTAPAVDQVQTKMGIDTNSESLSLNQQADVKKTDKALTGYDVYLNDTENPIATHVAEEEFLFTELLAGSHTAGVRAHYTTGISEAVFIDFSVTNGHPQYQVLFRVHMHAADFDPASDLVFITGSHLNWAEPGDDPENQEMTPANSDPKIYEKYYLLPAGTYEYKYFLNAGWEGGEWEGGNNRLIVLDQNMIIDNVFGDETDSSLNVDLWDDFATTVYPNPVRTVLNISSEMQLDRVRITDLTGRLVYEDVISGYFHQVNVSEFNQGIYLVQLFTNNGVKTVKVNVLQ
jgi:hypothetical protein